LQKLAFVVAELLNSVNADVVCITISGNCAGYKVLRVVNGSVDAYVHTTQIKKWDICAGDAILKAISGQMTTLTGQLLDYSDTQHPKNNDGLLATLDNHRKLLGIFTTAFASKKS